MLSKERLFRIMEVIEEQSFVTISELMEFLNASKSVSYTHLDVYKRQLEGVVGVCSCEFKSHRLHQ